MPRKRELDDGSEDAFRLGQASTYGQSQVHQVNGDAPKSSGILYVKVVIRYQYRSMLIELILGILLA